MIEFGGQFGGMLAMAFGMGCVSGWGFGEKKMLAPLREEMARERAECDRRVEALEAECKKLNEWMLEGMSRQLGQVRESTLRVIGGDGKDIP